MEIPDLENDIRHIICSAGCFAVLEYERDASVTAKTAGEERMKAAMGVRRRQLMVKLNGENSVTMEAGAMQWTAGNVRLTSGFRNTKEVVRRLWHSAVTDESIVKPRYEGEGLIVLEPTYKHILLQDVGRFGPQGMTISDGMFLACDENITIGTTARKSVSSTALGNEGFFNTNLVGNGVAALKSDIPQVELMEIRLDGMDDELRLDGSMAICWSTGLSFTVETSSKSLINSAINKEGLVNVYRGKGIVLISPVAQVHMLTENDEEEAKANPYHHHHHDK